MFIANWKMNGSQSMLSDWLEGVSKTLDESLQKQCLLCPPVCFLSEASHLISKNNLNISLGAQNIDPNNFSPLTGGIDGTMLRSIGSEFVIIGHSERREIYKESDSLLLEKLKSNLEEVKARGGKLYIFADEISEVESSNGMFVLNINNVYDYMAPILHTIPLQLLAYYVAVIKGADIDQPRNLAKSVTVE